LNSKAPATAEKHAKTDHPQPTCERSTRSGDQNWHRRPEQLASFVAANPGMSLSSAANRLVDEAMRMAEHPGVIFRTGPTGRRAALAGGPDVWEVIRAVKSAHAAEPGEPG
jgi:hypothetical protein